jgi:hypothetical protein
VPVISTLAVLPGSVFSIAWEALNVLPPDVTVTLTPTFVSVNSPASSTWTVNVGLLPALMWFRAGSGSSAVVPTLTAFSALPW